MYSWKENPQLLRITSSVRNWCVQRVHGFLANQWAEQEISVFSR